MLKRVLAVVATLGFVATGLLARAAHPAQATTRPRSTSGTPTQTQASESGESQSDDGGFALGPSTSRPQVQTGVS